MSQIINKIESVRTGKVAYKQEPLILEVKENSDYSPSTFYHEYHIKVTLGGSAKVRDKEELEQAERVVKRYLEEFIFGEFRPLLKKAQYLLYDHDIEQARAVIAEIERLMFYAS